MFVSLHQNGKMCEDIKEMKITDVQRYPYRIPLRNSFMMADHELHTRDGALVEIYTEEGITGVGEMAPLPEFGGGSLDAALVSLPATVTGFAENSLMKHWIFYLERWVPYLLQQPCARNRFARRTGES